MAERLTIGKLAKASGVRIDTVRFYERKGLIARGLRKQSSFREYTAEDARKIRFIKRAQELGFSLSEIQELLELRLSSKGTCAQVNTRSQAKLAEIDQKISDLRRIRSILNRVIRQCSNDEAPTSKCPILGSFDWDV